MCITVKIRKIFLDIIYCAQYNMVKDKTTSKHLKEDRK